MTATHSCQHNKGDNAHGKCQSEMVMVMATSTNSTDMTMWMTTMTMTMKMTAVHLHQINDDYDDETHIANATVTQ